MKVYIATYKILAVVTIVSNMCGAGFELLPRTCRHSHYSVILGTPSPVRTSSPWRMFR